MKKLIKHSIIKGEVKAPASKSYAQRAIAASLLANGTSVLRNYSPCKDSEAAIEIAKKLGAKVGINNNEIKVVGKQQLVSKFLNCGEAGLGIRMFTPIAATFEEEIEITGVGSLTSRPMKMLEKPLSDLGANCNTNNGFLPICVQGPLIGGQTIIDGSLSSQVITGLLMAAPLAKIDTEIIVSNLKSIPYIEMTMELLNDFGIEISNENFEVFKVRANQHYRPIVYNIEGDWSGASFLLVAGAIGGEVKVTNLNKDSKQADREIIEALKLVGANVTWHKDEVEVSKGSLNAFTFDASNCPDLFPPLAVLAANCKGVSKIEGVGRLKHKESDRAAVLKAEFAKVGVCINIVDDVMEVYGGSINGGEMHSNNDHRIAMAAAVLGVNSKQNIEVANAESIEKSYPGFFEDYQKIGGTVD